MKVRSFLLLALVFAVQGSFAQQTRILSPDGLTFVDVSLTEGNLTYRAGYRKVEKRDTTEVLMLEDSPLGFTSNIGDFSKGLAMQELPQPQLETYTYDLRQGKQSHISATYTHQDIPLLNADKRAVVVDFRVGNGNIALRYRIPMTGDNPKCIVVDSEVTGFDFPQGTTTFICPQSDAMVGWERTKPSYEEGYVWDEPVGTPSHYHQGYTFPCLFHEGEKGWVMISETGVDGLYCGSHLSDGTSEGLYTIAFPMQGENNGFGSTGAQFGLPGQTPWRTITLGQTLKPIMETTVTWDVVEPLYEPSRDYQAGRSTWSWILWQDDSINPEDQRQYIQLSHNLGWEYCLVDNWWMSRMGHEGIEDLARFARERNVTLCLWYNSNGGWSDAPQDPKQIMSNPIARKREMKWMQQVGIGGIKVDFFAGDKQETIRLYEQILSDANEYGLQVIFHGCTLPRGWERMYPNYCASEAVLASENLYFTQGANDMEGKNATLHPLLRNTVGSMDFGGTVLQARLHRQPGKGNYRRVGNAFELATAVAFQSSIQNFALTPRNLTENPAWEIDFMRRVPTAWDEVRFIDGYPGKYLVMARRHGNQWYVAALNAQDHELRNLAVELPFQPGQQVTCIADTAEGPDHSALSTLKVGKGSINKITIPAQGGIVMYE